MSAGSGTGVAARVARHRGAVLLLSLVGSLAFVYVGSGLGVLIRSSLQGDEFLRLMALGILLYCVAPGLLVAILAGDKLRRLGRLRSRRKYMLAGLAIMAVAALWSWRSAAQGHRAAFLAPVCGIAAAGTVAILLQMRRD